jgi:acetylornithine deacetylase
MSHEGHEGHEVTRIRRWVDDNRAAIIECVRNLVRIETQNLAPDGHEHKGQLAVAAMLNLLGCEVDVYDIRSVNGLLEHPRYWPARPCTGRPNVMGIRKGAGGGRSLMFSGHIDTVPVGPDPWHKDPWGGEVSDGKLWGIGAYDMKAGLAAAIMTVKALNDLGIRLKGDVMIESVVDEEFGGCNGTLAARLRYNADLAIVPEPTNLVVCPAHHGGLMLRVTFRGKPGWGFSPDKPVDPVHAIARFIVMLNAWAAQRVAHLSVPELYRHDPSLPVLINQLKAGDVTLPFFGDRVPSEAWLSVWIEVFPGMTQDDVMRDLRACCDAARQQDAVLAAFEPEWKPIRWLDGSQIAAGHPGVKMLADVVTAVRGAPAIVRGAPFACDGHMFNLCSPTPMVLLGSIGGQPHAPDEFIVIDDHLQLVEVFIRAAIAWCGAE